MMLLGRSTDGLIYLFEQPVRLLVVDDDPIMREFAIAQLSHPGGEIVTAGNGEEAWRELQAGGEFDLVISDLEMPTMNGFTLVEHIRTSERHAHLPVVVLTSRDDMFAIDRAYEVGATSFATKPVNWRLLGYQLRYVLRAWHMEAQVRRAHADAQRTSKLRDTLLTLLQHETRTPLNAIVGYTELVEKSLAGSGAGGAALPHLADLKQAGRNLNRILQRVFYYAQLNSGTVEFTPERLSVAGLLDDILRANADRAARKEIRLVARTHPIDLSIAADHAHLSRAVNELVKNALAGSPFGSVVSLEATESETGDEIVIVIADEGDGLDESRRSLCHAPFFQSEDPLTRTCDGLGLGIPTACRVVELHGGSLTFGPSPQAGVSARITLPLRPQGEDQDAKDRTAA